MYAELCCYSNFSFLRGASHPEELIQQAIALGYQALAITDECSVAGVVRAYRELRQLHDEKIAENFKLLIGSRFTSEEGLEFIVLAPDRHAYGQLTTLITRARCRSEKGSYCLHISDLDPATDGCLFIWLPNGDQCLLGSDITRSDSALQQSLHNLHDTCRRFITLTKSRLWIGLVNNLTAKDEHLCQLRRQLARRLNLPLTACGNVHCHIPQRQPLQDILTAIRLNTTVHSAGFNLLANRESSLQPLDELQQRFTAEELQQTLDIAGRCTFLLSELKYEYPHELVQEGHTAATWLRHQVEDGVKKRWPEGEDAKTRALIEKELQIIHELEYESYFLTVYDIVAFARSKDILCQGRGSAANSAVCYCLFITEVNPATSSLLFERFISRERKEPPDIDVDFEHERREEVIQFIYKKYGRKRAALTATVISYRLKSAIRDVGKAMGFDQTLLDQLSKSIAWWDKQDHLNQQLQALGIDIHNPHLRRFKYLVDILLGFPRHLSQHVGGFIISSGALDQLVPIENASMDDRTVVQWDKDDIETLGLMKIDVLALGMLTAIRKSFHLIEQVRGVRYQMSDLLQQHDEKTYAMLQRADTVGVFQVESRAQMSMLPRLKPVRFYDLVIQVAIVRPGPIQGDMVHPYLLRRNMKPDDIHYESEDLKPVLERTLGIPIFQEQVIALAMVAAGFTGGEADQLRRAMAAWKRKGGLEPHEEKLSAGMRERGYPDDFIQRIIAQIRGFGDYGFPESHAASFALLAYVSAWLKCHEPAAFCCGLLNAQPMGFYSPSQLVQDVRRHNIEVRPADVLHSQREHTLETDDLDRHPQRQPAIRLGLCLIQNLSNTGIETLLKRRAEKPFSSLADFTRRCRLGKKDMDALAHANALRSLSEHRFQARWDMQGLQQESPLLQQEQQRETKVRLPAPSEAQNLLEDYRSTNLTLGRHPMALLRNHPALRGCKRYSDLPTLRHKSFVRIAGIVTGRQRPGTATGVIFVTLEDETGNSNIVLWSDLVERQRAIVLHARLLLVKGVVERDSNVIHVIAGQLEDKTYLLGELETHSRDFH